VKTTDYVEQAQAFLEKTKTKMTVDFYGHEKYFDDDKEARNVYRVTLKRHGRVYAFKFGQSIRATESGEEPTAYDVLACLTKSDPGTFEDFCGEYGYDTDSRKAGKMYKAVVKEWQSVDRLFSDCLDALAEIQ
jgi:hypothetical protein